MKALYLSSNPRDLERVYGPEQRARIASLLGMEPAVCTELPADCSDIEAIFSTWGMLPLTKGEIAAKLPALKHVFYAAGSVQYFAHPFLESGVRVFSAWQANAVPVAQFSFAQILLACKGYYRVQAAMRTDRAQAHAMFAEYPGVYGIKIGILGCGAVGSMVCELLRSTGLTVLAYDPYMSAERAAQLGVQPASLEEIFSECLVISNHVPNLPSTVGLIRREHLMAMQPRATFINTGRGPQLNEWDLYDALRADATRTALLDVLTDEGRSDSKPITQLPNCFLTPHIAGSSGLEVRRMADYMADMLERVLTGSPCPYEVTPAMLETMA